MLMPFEWAVLTVQEARQLMEYIEKSTATKSMPRNYDKIYKAGMNEIYEKLRQFVEANIQYKSLHNLDTSDLMYRGDV